MRNIVFFGALAALALGCQADRPSTVPPPTTPGDQFEPVDEQDVDALDEDEVDEPAEELGDDMEEAGEEMEEEGEDLD